MDFALEMRRLSAWAQTQASAKLNPVELARICLRFWPEEEVVTAIAVCGAESGFRIHAKNVDKHHGQEDYGIFQINEIHKPDMSMVYGPEYNAGFAYRIWQKQGWTAWVAFDAGKHIAFIPMAEEAVRQALGQ